MKLVLASYFQEENHGTGRKIGISPSKPTSDEAVQCDHRFSPLDPGQLYWHYHKAKKDDPEQAGEAFVEAYRRQCEEFVSGVQKQAETENKTIFEVLPFKDGDTLLSWEREGNISYRGITAEYLRKLGYEVEEH